MTLRVLSQVNR